MPAIDASTPAFATSTTGPSITSAPFSPPAGSLLVALASADLGASAPSVTDSLGTHLTWTSRVSQATGFGSVVIYTAPCPAAQTNMTVTASTGGTNPRAFLQVVVVTGAAASQGGATASNSAYSASLAPRRANSLILTIGGRNDASVPSAALSGNTMTINGHTASGTDALWGGAAYATATTSSSIPAGTATTVGTNGSGFNSYFAALEVFAPGDWDIANSAAVGTEISTATTSFASPAWNSVTGRTIVVVARFFTGTVTSVTDTAGNTYTNVSGASNSGGGENFSTWVATPITGNAANVVTLHASPGLAYAQVFFWEVIPPSGGGYGIVDAAALGASASGSGPMTSASFTTTKASEVVLSVWSTAGGNTASSPTIGSVPATIGPSSSQANTIAGWTLETGVQTGIASQCTMTGTGWGVMAVSLMTSTSAQTLTPPGIASAGAFGSPTVTLHNQTLAPSGIASAGALGTPTVTQTGTAAKTLAPAGIASAQALGTPTVGRGAFTVHPVGIPSAETFGLQSIGRPVILPAPTGTKALPLMLVRRLGVRH